MRSKEVEEAIEQAGRTLPGSMLRALADYVSRLEGELAEAKKDLSEMDLVRTNLAVRADKAEASLRTVKALCESAQDRSDALADTLAEALRERDLWEQSHARASEVRTQLAESLASEKSKRLEAEQVAGELRMMTRDALDVIHACRKASMECAGYSYRLVSLVNGYCGRIHEMERQFSALSQSPAPAPVADAAPADKSACCGATITPDKFCQKCGYSAAAPKPEAKECGECHGTKTVYFNMGPGPVELGPCPSCQESKK